MTMADDPRPRRAADAADLGALASPPRRRDAEATSRKLDAQGRAYATGKRKNAVARVWIKPGKGKITSTAATARSISPGRCCA